VSNRPQQGIEPLPKAMGADDPGATRVDATLGETVGAAVFQKPTVMLAPLVARKAAHASAAAASLPGSTAGVPAPEISLTPHVLPGGERPDPRLVILNEPDSERAAAFRVLRHHMLEAGRPQVIVVSSAQGGEGKTTVAANLALALAECGRAKVLLAETHVRRPQLANVFRCVPPWCFAEQMAAHRAQPGLPWNVIELAALWLHLAPLNPKIEKAQLLDAPAFTVAMERLRLAGYDHIVIDAPPVLGSADVNLMADAADGVLLTARASRTTTRDLRRSLDQLGKTKVLGTVLVQ
jgi:Mrp family chromosome partitioning ATPase